MHDPHPLPPRLLAILQDMPLEELAFVAVPVRHRRDGWLKIRQQGFILRLALGATVTLAANAVGKTRKSAYRLRDRPGAASFAAAWDKALGVSTLKCVSFVAFRRVRLPAPPRGRRQMRPSRSSTTTTIRTTPSRPEGP